MAKMKDAIVWFKATFGEKIKQAVQGTPFDINMLTAIALQETYYIWGNFYKTETVETVLEICVGDTLDLPRRKAFPKTKADLVAAPKGPEMFKVARAALEKVGQYNATFGKIVATYPNKFCHGYGIFQYDLQFFRTDPDYFLQKKWRSFDDCVGVCVKELKSASKRAYPGGKAKLSAEEMTYVCIAYNKGSVDFTKGFKQGFKDAEGKYYGEYIWDYLQLAKSVP